ADGIAVLALCVIGPPVERHALNDPAVARDVEVVVRIEPALAVDAAPVFDPGLCILADIAMNDDASDIAFRARTAHVWRLRVDAVRDGRSLYLEQPGNTLPCRRAQRCAGCRCSR